MIVGKAYKFDAAHRLPKHKGKCSKVHGHTWTVEVELENTLTKDWMVLDFEELDKEMEKILKTLDHKLLNSIRDLKPPTCERIALHIFLKLSKAIPELCRVKVQEGSGGYAIFRTKKEVR